MTTQHEHHSEIDFTPEFWDERYQLEPTGYGAVSPTRSSSPTPPTCPPGRRSMSAAERARTPSGSRRAAGT